MSVLSRLLTRPDGGSTAAIRIEPMRRRDLREVMPIELDAYPTPWTRVVFEGELRQVANGSRYYVVARRRRTGRLVGFAGLWFVDDPDGNQAHVTNVAVAPEARREGIAVQLLTALANAAIERRCVAWTLEVRASNLAAQELYRLFGFAPAGVRKRYYENTEDAIVMWCHELGSPDYPARLRAIAGRDRSGAGR